jgi:TP53 regulating kinase-like protein
MIIARGAEAVLKKEGEKLVKERISKGYRIKPIDEKLRKERTEYESRLINEARRNGINVPLILEKDLNKMELVMEFLDGPVLRDELPKLPKTKQEEVCVTIGKMIGELHKAGIIHGDLTTSNMILHNKMVYFIDFGLGFFSKNIEDKAVDLHLIKEALVAKHNKIWKSCFNNILKGYKSILGSETKKTIERLNAVEKRGRYSNK